MKIPKKILKSIRDETESLIYEGCCGRMKFRGKNIIFRLTWNDDDFPSVDTVSVIEKFPTTDDEVIKTILGDYLNHDDTQEFLDKNYDSILTCITKTPVFKKFKNKIKLLCDKVSKLEKTKYDDFNFDDLLTELQMMQ